MALWKCLQPYMSSFHYCRYFLCKLMQIRIQIYWWNTLEIICPNGYIYIYIFIYIVTKNVPSIFHSSLLTHSPNQLAIIPRIDQRHYAVSILPSEFVVILLMRMNWPNKTQNVLIYIYIYRCVDRFPIAFMLRSACGKYLHLFCSIYGLPPYFISLN